MGNRIGNKFGWHSGVLTAKDAKIRGDLYVQDDIVFSDVSAGTLGVTGGIDMGASTSAIALDMADVKCSTAAIDIQGTGLTGRAIRIGVKDTGLKISSGVRDAEPANNYLFGLFSEVKATEATSTDELRSAWIRTRVNVNCDIGSNAGWGYGVCGAEVQLKFYGGTTSVYAWQNSALWAQLESQAATTTFKNGSYSQAVLANVGLTSATVESGAVVAGVTINSNTASTGVTIDSGGGFYGLFITDKSTTNLNFQDGIHIEDGSCTTGINLNGGATAYVPILIGAKSNSANVGVVLAGALDNTGGVQIFCDDGGAALTYITSPIWARYLVTKDDQSSGSTATGLYAQLKTKPTTLTTITAGSYTALKAYMQVGGALTLNGTNAELSIINAAMSFEGTYTATSGTLSGIDININDGAQTVGTHTGLLIRKDKAGTKGWTNAIYIPTNATVAGLVIGDKSSNSAIGHHIGVANSADNAGDKAIAVFCDDNNAVLATDAQGINSRCLILAAQTGAYAMDALRGHLRGVASVTPSGQKSFSATSGYVEFSGTYTIGDATNGVFMCGMSATVELGGTPTIAANSRICGILLSGNFTSAINGATSPSVGVMYQGQTYGYQFALGFHDGVSGMLSTTSGATTPTHKVAVWINGIGTRYIKLYSDA